jgi:hypothetical protein
MAGVGLSHLYRYESASKLDRSGLRLATSGGAEPWPFFFQGRLTQPRTTARLMSALSRVVGSRFFVPPAMLTRMLAQADPVVTCGVGVLRFEGFSACASAYARVDLTPEAYAGDVVAHGTTNVDFNATMRAAFASVTDGEELRLTVGIDRVELEKAGAAVVERKVPLPLRWLKGFVEVQAYQARMRPRFILDGAETTRFLRSLPRASTKKHEQWLVPSGRGLRVSMTESKTGVRLSATERLRVLEDIAPMARTLRVYSDEEGEASAWEIDTGGARFTLVLSADVWRGFSGEGQALAALAAMEQRAVMVAATRAQLRWQAAVRPEALTASVGSGVEDVRSALLVLGSRGLVGFDLAAEAFFHRELPFDLNAVDALQPRLKAAKELLTEGTLTMGEARADGAMEVFVPGSGVTHRVLLADEPSCTCPWFAKYEGARGSCKHVLAAQMFTGGEEP